MNDARQRLEQCVVIVGDTPYYISRMTERNLFNGYNLLTLKEVEGIELGTTPVPMRLGYVNTDRGAVFVSRRPCRKVRQGICGDNLYAQDFDRVRDILVTRNFGLMLTGEYPSIEECIAKIDEGHVNRLAFGRMFALARAPRRGYNLMYCGNAVGQYLDGKFNLKEDFECLREVLNAST